MKTFAACHSVTSNGIVFHDWPDGQPYLKQDAVLVDVFDTVKDEIAKMYSDMMKKSGKMSKR